MVNTIALGFLSRSPNTSEFHFFVTVRASSYGHLLLLCQVIFDGVMVIVVEKKKNISKELRGLIELQLIEERIFIRFCQVSPRHYWSGSK